MGAELLAPAGDFATALAAFDAGADAVYCGLGSFSARAFAKNLSLVELKDLVAYARSCQPPRRVYVAFNTLVDESEMPRAVDTLASLADIGPDALIVQDLGVARICRRHFPSLELHASTQLVAHNLAGVLALKERGFRRVVLARELSLEEVSLIARRCGALKILDDGRPETELECFIHGALCYSISGLCLFGSMEKGRSGNRGACPYCCREERSVRRADGRVELSHPFSMKDLRLGMDAQRLVSAGVSSLKIEGRMKSPLYVAAVTRLYRQILDKEEVRSKKEEGRGKREAGRGKREEVSFEDIETVFSRRTTELYFGGHGGGSSPIDPGQPGHLGAVIGKVKRITSDRDGRRWLCFRPTRELEKHDGLQFDISGPDGRRMGFGISEMRLANPPRAVFEAPAGTDVEVLLPEAEDGGKAPDVWAAIKPGAVVYCSMSNAVKRMFPPPSYRPGAYAGICPVDVVVALSKDGISARTTTPVCADAFLPMRLDAAKDPARTAEGVRKAFSRLGGTDYRLGSIKVDDPDGLFAPPHALNDLRRDLVERLDAAREAKLQEQIADVKAELDGEMPPELSVSQPRRTLKIRDGQKVPPGEWDEVVVAMGCDGPRDPESVASARLALPVWTSEADFNRLRASVKRLVRAGHAKWEASDLATLDMLKSVGAEDVTADWTLYAFNSQALLALAESGVRRVVASPDNSPANLRALAESGFAVEFLAQQSTPLFMSLTRPEGEKGIEGLSVFVRDGLWVTTRPVPRTFGVPADAPSRLDLSWDPPDMES